MFDIEPQRLQYWYKNFLSDYFTDIETDKWQHQKILTVNKTTAETEEKPVYVFKPENLGSNMSIDDKAIGHEGFTILSNNDLDKIALMIESTNAEEVEKAIELFDKQSLNKIKTISMDMSPTYALVAKNLLPNAAQVIDKFHVMKYVYDAVSDVRNKTRKEIVASLTPGKQKTQEDKEKLSKIELIQRVRYAITQSEDKWSEGMKKTVNQVFKNHQELKIAYQISQNFKQWYDYKNSKKSVIEITKTLSLWYEQALQLSEFKSVVKMIRKHEKEIINFFLHGGVSNAKAERLNGKINRFVSNNYGIKNKDFSLYRIANYFA
jgi:transposase